MISTPDLCDAHPELVRVVTPMFRSFGGRAAFRGEVWTVKCHEDNSLVRPELEQPGRGRVLVVDGGGSMRCALLGDILADLGAIHGWAGVIVHGCVRDVEQLHAIELGILALGSHPRKSLKRREGQVGVPVTFGGVTFHPGEFVYADRNGVIVSAGPLVD